MAATLIPIPLHPNHTLHLLLLTALSADQLEALPRVAPSLDAALLEPSLIPSPRCLASAAAKALLAAAARARATPPTLHAELVRCLHGTRGIAEAHRALAPRGAAVLLAVLDAGRGGDGAGLDAGGAAAAALAALAAAVGGAPGDLLALWGGVGHATGPGVDAAGVAAVWRIAPEEAALAVPGLFSGLEAAVLQRIACGGDA